MYFEDYTTVWQKKFVELVEYINSNSKLPSQHDKNTQIRSLGNWVSSQKQNYKNKKGSMKNEEIYIQWNKMINSDQYKKYF